MTQEIPLEELDSSSSSSSYDTETGNSSEYSVSSSSTINHSTDSESNSSPTTTFIESATGKESGKAKEEKPQTASSAVTLTNLVKAVIGAGILSVPNSFSSIGLIPSLVLIVCIAILSYIASIMDVKLHQKVESTGLDDLIGKLMGRWGSITYSIVVIIFLEAAMIAYLIINGDNLKSWFAFGGIDISPFKYRILTILIYSIIPIALMIPKNFKFIGIFSSFSLALMVFYICATIYKLVDAVQNKGGISKSLVYAKIDTEIFSAIGVFAMAFALPTVVIPLLQHYTEEYKKRRNIVAGSMFCCALITILPSALLYLVFGSESDGNILNSFPNNDIIFTIVRAGFFFSVTISFPVIGKSVMCNWSQLVFGINQANDLKGWRFWLIFWVTAGTPLIIAMFLPQVKPAISIGGALGGCLACYTFPSICWIIASEKKISDPVNILCVIFAIVGIIFAVIATYQSIVDAIDAFKSLEI
ncbi:Transmembrane amino acid transporter protein [Tritrichomonas foetus]|uniref:Transmembrane amino acid transporter protein n=1 Tax=Tritrichomonas foetus TaxID=1144522 RepID=A0A1J4JH36_9EUKA|nr:Transmembrane amino acid transporter protein [Tritrichomonas foetus]|eukprot:OHS98466.1 Transmembrane amino acid transporter protein [Tritrichomonas foetus]